MPDEVFDRLLLIKNAHDTAVADSLADDTQASIPAWVKYRFLVRLVIMA